MDDRLACESQVRAWLDESIEAQSRVRADCMVGILSATYLVVECFRRGGKLLLCGNGGSAADAQHIAAEFVGRAQAGRERPPLAAIAITSDTACLTAIGNDYGFAQIFQRQVAALGQPADVLVTISTSGDSVNVVNAVHEARAIGMKTVGLLGGTGGALGSLVDAAVVVPSVHTTRVQESHITIAHIICDLTEQILFPGIATDPSKYGTLARWDGAANQEMVLAAIRGDR